MKGYFQTTLIEVETYPQNALIGFNPSINKSFSSMCILGLTQAYVTENYDFLTTYSALYYKIITSYLKKEFLKCI